MIQKRTLQCPWWTRIGSRSTQALVTAEKTYQWFHAVLSSGIFSRTFVKLGGALLNFNLHRLSFNLYRLKYRFTLGQLSWTLQKSLTFFICEMYISNNSWMLRKIPVESCSQRRTRQRVSPRPIEGWVSWASCLFWFSFDYFQRS